LRKLILGIQGIICAVSIPAIVAWAEWNA
jgi:hypothetical protein